MHAALALALILAAGDGDDAPADRPEEPTIELSVGTQKVLHVEGISRIAVGDPSTVDVKTLGGDDLLFIGAAEGRTTLLMWRRNGTRLSYRVVVRKLEIDGLGELKTLLRDSPDARIRVVGDHVFVEGLIGSPEDFGHLKTYSQVTVFAKLDPALVRRRVAQINESFARAGLPNIKATLVGNRLILEGAVDDEAQRDRAQRIAGALFDDLIPFL